MQKYFSRILLVFFILLYATFINAQGINQVNILPPVISNQDTVRLETDVWLEYAPCKLDSVEIFYACGAVAVNAFYSSYFDPDTCNYNATIDLGRFPNGFYALTYNMYYQGSTLVDTYQDSFTVSSLTGLEQQEYMTINNSLFPNPSSGCFYLNLIKESSFKLEIFDINGRLVYSTNGSGKKDKFVSTDLQKGFYFYRLQYDHQTESGKVIITE